jgi:transposase
MYLSYAKAYYKEVSPERIKQVMIMERIEHGNYNLLRIIFAANKNTLTGGVTAMRSKNDTRQVEKRQRITTTTLIVGMDIGCEFNAMCVMNKEGIVFGRYPKIYNSRKGFDYFHTILETVKKKHGFTDVLIGMEPTGHYWRKIAYFAMDKQYEVRFIRTTALKHQRELDESSSAKNDIRDAYTIANITREGKYIDTVIEDNIFRQLRTLAHTRERIQRFNTGSKHALKGVLEDYFPELKHIFWSMKAKGLWAILSHCPFPEDVLRMEIDVLTALIAQSTRRKIQAHEKALQIYKAAQHSIGLQRIGDADRYRVAAYLSEIRHSELQLKDIELQMKTLLRKIPFAEYILSMPGIGTLTCGVFLGELGNPCNFTNPKQIVKYAGYDPQEHDSGQRTGRKIISKKGRWLLRKYLYFMAMRVVHRNPFFKDYYENKQKTMTKKEALCAVVIKLVKVIFALLRDKRTFTEKQSCLKLAA